ncbi:MAG: hypothetical protein ACR2JJ_10485 [Sphingomicrobium sp.]
MRIRMTMSLAGPQYALAPGDEHEFPQDEAVRLIKAGFAVPVAEVKLERAVKPMPERRAPARKKASR